VVPTRENAAHQPSLTPAFASVRLRLAGQREGCPPEPARDHAA
jgi:hypothetical protein